MHKTSYCAEYYMAKAHGDEEMAKSAERQMGLTMRKEAETQELQAKISKFHKTASDAKEYAQDIINSSYEHRRAGRFYANQTVSFLERTLPLRIAISKMIDEYTDICPGHMRSAHRRFNAANRILEKTAGTNHNPTLAMENFIIACSSVIDDLSDLLDD